MLRLNRKRRNFFQSGTVAGAVRQAPDAKIATAMITNNCKEFDFFKSTDQTAADKDKTVGKILVDSGNDAKTAASFQTDGDKETMQDSRALARFSSRTTPARRSCSTASTLS